MIEKLYELTIRTDGAATMIVRPAAPKALGGPQTDCYARPLEPGCRWTPGRARADSLINPTLTFPGIGQFRSIDWETEGPAFLAASAAIKAAGGPDLDARLIDDGRTGALQTLAAWIAESLSLDLGVRARALYEEQRDQIHLDVARDAADPPVRAPAARRRRPGVWLRAAPRPDALPGALR